MTQLGEAFVPIRATMDKLDRDLAQSKGKIEGSLGGVSKNVKALGAAAVAGIGVAAIAATKAVADFAVDSIAEFQQFETGMSEVFTLMPGITEDAMRLMEQDVLAFSAEVGRTTDEVVPALYQAISAGVPADNVFDFMQVASDAALGGVTDLETSVDALSTVINAYGAENISAQEASDLLFTAVKGGKTTFDEMGSSLFNVIPTAASLGVEFGNVTAAIASMTAQGTPTAQATTQIRRLLIELSKAGGEAAGTFERMAGSSFVDFIAQGGNLQEALQLMETAASRSGVRLSDLFSSVEAGAAALTLTGAGTAKFTAELLAAESAEGATAAAAEEMAGTLEYAERKVEAATEALKIQVGQALGPNKIGWLNLKLEIIETTAALIEHNMTQDMLMGETRKGTEAVLDAAQAQVDLAAALGGSSEAMYTAEDALQIINTSWGYGASNTEDLRIQALALDNAIDLLNSGFEGTGRELAEMSLSLAANSEVTRVYVDDIIAAEIASIEAARAMKSVGDAAAEEAFALGLLDVETGAYEISAEQVTEAEEARAAAHEAAKAASERAAEAVAALSQTMTGYFTAALPAIENTDSMEAGLFKAAEAAGADAAQLAILGGALGLYSDEAVESALRTALIQAKMDELAERFTAGGLTVSGMRGELTDFITAIDNTGAASQIAAGEIGLLDGMSATVVLESNFEEVTEGLSEADTKLAEKLDIVGEQATSASTTASTAFGEIAASAETEMGAMAVSVDTAVTTMTTSTATGFGTMTGQVGMDTATMLGDIETSMEGMLSATETNVAGMVSAFEGGMGDIISAVGVGLDEAVATAEGYVVQFGGVGTNIVTSMTNSLLAGGGALADAAARIVREALAAAEGAAGIASPSKVAQNQMEEIIAGYVVSAQANGGEVAEVLVDVIEAAFEAAGNTISAGKRLGSISNFFSGMLVDPAKAALDEIDDSIAGLTDDIAESMGGVLPDLTGDLDAMYAAARAAGDLDLAGQLSEYQQLQWDRNRAEDEYIKQQERLLAIQEQQQQLDFLQNQLDLIQQLQQAGLDPSEVLEGITLGLDASPEDLLDASQAALTALIQEADLQLGQVQDTIGSSFVSGMTAGVLSGEGALVLAVRQVVQAALDAAADEAGVASPSWKTRAIFEYFVEGGTRALNDHRHDWEKSAADMTSLAVAAASFGSAGLDVGAFVQRAEVQMAVQAPEADSLLSVYGNRYGEQSAGADGGDIYNLHLTGPSEESRGVIRDFGLLRALAGKV